MTLIGKWALLTVKFILEDVHGSSDHPSSRPKRISCRTYIHSNKFPDSYVLLLWQMSRRMPLAARGLGSVSFFDRKKSRWRPLRWSCVPFYRLFICFSREVTNEQHLPLYDRSLFTQPNRLFICFRHRVMMLQGEMSKCSSKGITRVEPRVAFKTSSHPNWKERWVYEFLFCFSVCLKKKFALHENRIC